MAICNLIKLFPFIARVLISYDIYSPIFIITYYLHICAYQRFDKIIIKLNFSFGF